MEKLQEASDAAGRTGIVIADCEWSTADWQFFGVEEFPSIEALSKYIAALREIGFSQHVDETYVVGTPWGEGD